MVRRILSRVRRAVRRLAFLTLAPLAPLRRGVRHAADSVAAIRVIGRGFVEALSARRSRLDRTGRQLRIGVDIRPFYEPLTGVGWYLFHILDELSRHDDLEILLFGDSFATESGPTLHAAVPSAARCVQFDFRRVTVTRPAAALARAAFPVLALLEDCDLFFGANYFLPRSLSAIARHRVVTVHDLTFRRHPELLQAETLSNLQREMTREIFRADRVICVSEATRRDLVELFSIDPPRAVTIRSGMAPAGPVTDTTLDLPSAYILFVSTIEPRKNLDMLLDAFEILKDRGRYRGKLLIAGRVGWKSERTMERIRTSRWREEIQRLDYVPKRDLAALYRDADLFVFPSIYEGFGFPLLEAMQHGTATIAARTSSLPEIGGDASLYFDPGDVGMLVELMERVLFDSEVRHDLIERGRKRAESFRWSDAADRTLAVFRDVAERR